MAKKKYNIHYYVLISVSTKNHCDVVTFRSSCYLKASTSSLTTCLEGEGERGMQVAVIDGTKSYMLNLWWSHHN